MRTFQTKMDTLLLLIFSLFFMQVKAIDPNDDSLGMGKLSQDIQSIDKNLQGVDDMPTKLLPFESKFETEVEYTLPTIQNLKRMKRLKFVVKPTGSTITLKCKGSGYPKPNITWYKDNETPLMRDMGEIKFYNWYVQLENLVTSDSGEYMCLLCNVVGCTNFTYELEIIERFPSKPYIKDGYPKNITVLANTSGTFECPQIIAGLEPYIEWIRPKNFTNFNNRNYYATDDIPYGIILQKGDNDNINPEVLIIKNVTHEHEGWYTCVAANTLGHSMASAYLKVVDAESEYKTEVKYTLPTFQNLKRMNRNKAVVKPAGSTITLKCKGSGYPEPNITWYKDNETPLMRDLGEVKYSYDNWSVRLEDLVTSDSGQYKCLICNAVGCTNFTYVLRITESLSGRPILLGDFKNNTVFVGETINITCRHVSSLDAYIQWVSGRIDENSFNASAQIGDNISNAVYPEVLVIKNVTHNHEGWYTCVAANIFGYTMGAGTYLKVVDV